MNIQKLTQIVMAFAVIALLGYDVFALIKGGTEGTISHWMIVSSYDYPLIPFFWGFLTGHFFWRLRDTIATKNLGRKTTAIALGLLFLSTSAFAGVKLNPVLDGSDQVRFMRYLDATREVEKVINSEEFKGLIYERQFTFTKKSPGEIFASIYAGEELLKPGKDGVWDWKVGFYYKKFTKVIGWTNPKTMTVWVNTAKFDTYELWDIADNITHEYLHKIGYDHATAKDHESVPYAVGYIVRDLVKKNLTSPPVIVQIPIKDPVKDPAPTRRSWWVRLRSYLFGR